LKRLPEQINQLLLRAKDEFWPSRKIDYSEKAVSQAEIVDP
jgi:hypothetical protein